jgi:tetratricopeptide (TPR) repeat protein
MYVVAFVAGADTYLIGSRYLADQRGMPAGRAQVTAGVIALLIALIIATVPTAIYQHVMRRRTARRRLAAALRPPRPDQLVALPVRPRVSALAPPPIVEPEPPTPEPTTTQPPPTPLPAETDESQRDVIDAARRLAEIERVFGADDAHTFAARRDLASAYWGTGQLEQATVMYESILADCEQALGATDQETLTCRSDLAAAYEMEGRLDEAITLYAHTLAVRERVLGAQHPDTMTSRSSLAVAYSVRDNLTRGRREDDAPTS